MEKQIGLLIELLRGPSTIALLIDSQMISCPTRKLQEFKRLQKRMDTRLSLCMPTTTAPSTPRLQKSFEAGLQRSWSAPVLFFDALQTHCRARGASRASDYVLAT
jgi:hypothetical protein